MKRILLAIVLFSSTLGYSQMADYSEQELVIDVGQEISRVELTIIIDDIYYETHSYSYIGSQVTMYLAEGLDYNLVINGAQYFSFTIMSRDVIDEQDISISSDVAYRFSKGILIFE
tara:strand:- start:264 stop:611 length:348 start_codon:yes stop_codon:yes gene_type:complete